MPILDNVSTDCLELGAALNLLYGYFTWYESEFKRGSVVAEFKGSIAQ